MELLALLIDLNKNNRNIHNHLVMKLLKLNGWIVLVMYGIVVFHIKLCSSWFCKVSLTAIYYYSSFIDTFIIAQLQDKSVIPLLYSTDKSKRYCTAWVKWWLSSCMHAGFIRAPVAKTTCFKTMSLCLLMWRHLVCLGCRHCCLWGAGEAAEIPDWGGKVNHLADSTVVVEARGFY